MQIKYRNRKNCYTSRRILFRRHALCDPASNDLRRYISYISMAETRRNIASMADGKKLFRKSLLKKGLYFEYIMLINVQSCECTERMK